MEEILIGWVPDPWQYWKDAKVYCNYGKLWERTGYVCLRHLISTSMDIYYVISSPLIYKHLQLHAGIFDSDVQGENSPWKWVSRHFFTTIRGLHWWRGRMRQDLPRWRVLTSGRVTGQWTKPQLRERQGVATGLYSMLNPFCLTDHINYVQPMDWWSLIMYLSHIMAVCCMVVQIHNDYGDHSTILTYYGLLANVNLWQIQYWSLVRLHLAKSMFTSC